MVQCDACDSWSHYTCVGVGDDVSERAWLCNKCAASSAPQVNKEPVSVASGSQPVWSPLPASKPDDTDAPIDQRSENGSTSSKCGASKARRKKIELMRLEEERQANIAYLQKKYSIMQMYDSDDSDDDGNDVQAASKCKISREAANPIAEQPSQSLTTQQLSARHVVPRQLPVFTGRPDEWPLFISSYENSTKICGFSNDENLLRLQQSLKGKALEYVVSKLTLPCLVPEIIATLRMVFGRPEHITASLLTKLRAAPNVNSNRLESLVSFALEVKNLTTTMTAAGLHAHLNNPMLIQELLEKIPPQMRLTWAMTTRTNETVNLTTFSDWLFTMAEAASSVMGPSLIATAPHENEKRKTHRVGFHEEEASGSVAKCAVCKDSHLVPKCQKFQSLSYSDKWDAVHKKKLCRTCLKIHELKHCPNRKECGINDCTAKHHPLLHKPESVNNSVPPAVVAIHQVHTSNTLYKIIPVTVHGKNTSIDVYAFLDDGSGPTLIEKSVVQQIHASGVRKGLCLKWTDGSTRSEKDSEQLDLIVSSRGNPDKKQILHDVRSVHTLDLPSQTLIVSELATRYKHLRGLPVDSYRDAVPKIIIGLNNKKVAMPLKFREGKSNEPAARKTRLGWTIFGVLDSSEETRCSTQLQMHICECDNDIALQRLVADNMAIENPVCRRFDGDFDDRINDEQLREHVVKDGLRFVVKLLWKNQTIEMPDNFEMAMRRLVCFEKKIAKEPHMRARVSALIDDMVGKGYIKKLTEHEASINPPRKWYLPVFMVRNPNKPDKIRLVWDAAAEFKGISLNGCLEKGPDLLIPLPEILCNFRIGKIGICADIAEMFLRVAVSKEDACCQRFLWRHFDSSRPADVYELQVLSFGASCSPALAQYVKNRNAKEFEEQYPRAVKSITKRHYVDDMLDSVNTIAEAVQLASDVREIHKHGNFHIRNWLSNSSELVCALGEHGRTDNFCHAGRTIDYVIEPEKVLGMWWHTATDTFTFSLKFTKANQEILRNKRLPTKRELLRLLMSIFDPLGLLSYFTINMKILLQHTWRSGTDWDEAIPGKYALSWTKLISSLSNVQNVQVPRCYFRLSNSDESCVELHIMVDASEFAYAAVAYFRIQSEAGTEVSLVCSKSKIAPLRPVSIPRMELLAAVMGERLGNALVEAHDMKIVATHYWTDSKTVLSWLRSDPRMYKQFVMFRVGEIQETTNIENWRYVPSKLNVADLATKSHTIDFSPTSLWYTGSAFLYLPATEWPTAKPNAETTYADSHNVDELRQTNDAVHCAIHVLIKPRLIDADRFSKWERLLRCAAYVLRAVTRFKSGRPNPQRQQGSSAADDSSLTTDEMLNAMQLLFRLAQAEAFTHDIQLLTENPMRILPKTSALRTLSPFIDERQVIRMRGRLEKAAVVDEAMKNPIILPKHHRITYLLVEGYHRAYKHANNETIINEIFQTYHIPCLRRLLRTIRYNCQLCKLRLATPSPPEMGTLPEARVEAFNRAFTFVGVDFFGPFLASIGRRTEKRYGVVFTCLTCRAIHIEVAHSLSMNSCIIAVRNFIARRGTPRHFYSDNGTNLRTAEKELRIAYQQIDFGAIGAEFTNINTKWTFITPASPHTGGAWERMVRSIKTVLYQIITPATKLTDEKLHNLLLEVESIINRRPLTYLSLETAEQEALTPNHFLLGSTDGSKPPGKFETSDEYLRSSWRHSQLLADRFWKRWVAEYLPTLTRRTKWFNKVKPLECGDVVIIVDQNLPRHCWPKGIVTATIVGSEGQVRSASVRTASGVYLRPACKLAVLDVRP